MRSDSVLLDLGTLRGAHDRVDRVFATSAFRRAEEFNVVDAVHLELDVHKDGERYRLTGHVRSVLEIPCCRCLDGYRQPVDLECDLLYVPFGRNTGTGEREVEGQDLSMAFYTGQTLDLGQLMNEQFYLALPMKPLCSESCKGLCPECGANMTQSRCTCERGWRDPRWAALEGLRKGENGSRQE